MLDGTQDVGAGYLYTLEVDAEAGSLTLKNTSAAAAAHPWLSINRDAGVVYASGWSDPVDGHRTFSSYNIEDDFSVSLLNTVASCGTKPIANHFIPQAGAYGAFYGVDFVNPCGEVWSIGPGGEIETKIQSLPFMNGSTLHGFANTSDLKYLYIMNLGGNIIQSYSIDLGNGTLSPLADTSPSESGAGPRHAVIHPLETYMYVIDEEGLRVDQFAVDAASGILSYTNISLAVTPFGLSPANASDYWGDEIALSSDSKTLYVSTRARDASQVGYLAGWSLDTIGNIESSLFVIPTPEGGGTSNILSTSPWADESKDMLILTDQDTGFVALYQLQETNMVLLDRVNITGTNCCSGSVWLD
ncbi:3-carboxy-cis cis-mucoante lactonizing enzyme [Stereum hirsutum FP-91666 SS1]|uniref:3-carboxy-cis cis-mucoante lactonizing enzyme n=1 Tax=Stereum hirsutum (strain FP-91666) TaxID=721885 RepID=UPI00044495F9|nr:3-carboxy-cis cis-mucoante lactonizing enzyme [Stereum hirsutum FP-91666 SS1]EIM82151.1 3-carboxy-cis cis-mucoante lactonizing enzyme [Stereum hirsutum FP-91666 SS1]